MVNYQRLWLMFWCTWGHGYQISPKSVDPFCPEYFHRSNIGNPREMMRKIQLKKPRKLFLQKIESSPDFFPVVLSSFSHGNCLSDMAMVFFFLQSSRDLDFSWPGLHLLVAALVARTSGTPKKDMSSG